MLLAITYQLRDELTARGVPYPVRPGPLATIPGSMGESQIVVERDRSAGDTVAAPSTIMRNPTLQWKRGIGFRVRVWTRSTLDGAIAMDHERIADHVVDQILLAMRAIVSGRKTEWRVTGGGLLSAADLSELGAQSWAGVVYELRCQIDRGVTDRTYQDVAASEATAGGTGGFGFANTETVTGAGGRELPSASTR